jgi:hypothetical protein
LLIPSGTELSSRTGVGSSEGEKACRVFIQTWYLLVIFLLSVYSVSTPGRVSSSRERTDNKVEGEADEEEDEFPRLLRIFCVIVSQVSDDINLIADT